MAHWREVLPNPILTVALHDWVRDFDATRLRQGTFRIDRGAGGVGDPYGLGRPPCRMSDRPHRRIMVTGDPSQLPIPLKVNADSTPS
jgi:hypothetical protein